MRENFSRVVKHVKKNIFILVIVSPGQKPKKRASKFFRTVFFTVFGFMAFPSNWRESIKTVKGTEREMLLKHRKTKYFEHEMNIATD